MSKFMMVPRKVGEYHEGLNAITLDLLENIRRDRDADTAIYNDVSSLLFKWAFECKLTIIIIVQNTERIFLSLLVASILGRKIHWMSFVLTYMYLYMYKSPDNNAIALMQPYPSSLLDRGWELLT